MKRTQLKILTVLIASITLTSSTYAYDEMNAKGDCINVIERNGNYHKTSNKHVKNLGHKSFQVTGNIKSRDDNTIHSFNCEIKHGRVVNWHVNRHAKNSARSTNAQVGAGLLAIAAIAAIANNNNAKGADNNRHYQDYNTGGSPFDDMRYLKRQCKHNLVYHIGRAHGRVSKLRLTTTHLYRQTLSGRGFVIFDDGYQRDLDYNCEYDYHANIIDGHYHFGNF